MSDYVIFLFGIMFIMGLIFKKIDKKKEACGNLSFDEYLEAEKKENEENVFGKSLSKRNVKVMNNTEETFNEMHSILEDLGCNPQKESDSELSVAYQGENFVVQIGGYYAHIWDPGWSSINVNDPNFGTLQEAINIANCDFGPSIVWTKPDENGIVYLHSRLDILLHPNLPNKDDYIKSVFNTFFEKKENLRGNLHSLMNEQKNTPNRMRPIGFMANMENDQD